jgi:hypothetical protein
MYDNEIEALKIDNMMQKLSVYINRTKWNLDSDYIYCYFKGNELKINQRIRTINAIGNDDVIELIGAKDILVRVEPYNNECRLERVKENISIGDLKRNLFMSYVFCIALDNFNEDLPFSCFFFSKER